MKKVLFSCLLLVLFDAGTKFFAHSIPPGGIEFFTFPWIRFSLDFVTNTGVAWGLFPGNPLLLLVFRLAVIAALLVYLARNRENSFSLTLILAGAVGNSVDLICYRHVVDFLHFWFFNWSFPVFNFADSYITIGALLLFLFPRKKHVNV